MYQVLRIMYRIVFFFFLILTTCYMLPNTAHAEGIRLKIQPATLQIRATPPADIHAPFTIENPGNDPVDLTIVFKRFRDKGDMSGQVVYTNSLLSTDNDAFFKTIQVLDNKVGIHSLTLGPKQKKNLELEIVALNEDAQDHYFSIVFLTQSGNAITEPTEDSSFSSVQAGIAIPVLVSLNQVSEKNTFINNFSAPLFLQKGPVSFDIQVQNNGSHFTTVKGSLFITNMFGQTIGKVDINTTNILSGSTRDLVANQQNNWSTEEGLANKVIWPEKLLFGIYTAKLTLAILPDQTLYTRTIHFAAFPVVGIVFVFLAVIISISVLIRIKKKVSQG